MLHTEKLHTEKYLWIIFGILLIIRFLYIINIGIAPDEAYYWVWTRFLSFGYFDHPPMVAWLTYCTTALFGDTIAGIKAAAFTGHAIASFCILILAKKYCTHFSSRMILLLLLWFSVIIGIDSLVLTPDITQYIFWSAGMLAGYYALFESSSRAWIVPGIIAGFGLLSKYVFALFIVSFVLFVLISKEHRSLFKRPYPYLATIIACVIFLPNILWNAQHHWSAFSFQMKHGLGKSAVITFAYIGDYIAGQFGVATPFLLVTLILALIVVLKKYRNDPRLMYLTLLTIVPLTAFALSSFKSRCEANWPAPAYLSGFILIAWLWDKALDEHTKRTRIWVVFSVTVSFILSMLVYVHIFTPVLPIPYGLDITKQIRGWKEFAADVQAVRKKADPALTMPVCTNRYQETSLLAFYLPDRPRTFSLNYGRRSNHYALLDNRDKLYDTDCLFVEKLHDGMLPAKLTSCFETMTQLGTIYLHQSTKKIKYGVFLVRINRQACGWN